MEVGLRYICMFKEGFLESDCLPDCLLNNKKHHHLMTEHPDPQKQQRVGGNKDHKHSVSSGISGQSILCSVWKDLSGSWLFRDSKSIEEGTTVLQWAVDFLVIVQLVLYILKSCIKGEIYKSSKKCLITMAMRGKSSHCS